MLVLIHRFRHRVAFERLAGAVLWFFGTDLIPAAGVRYTQESNHSFVFFGLAEGHVAV